MFPLRPSGFNREDEKQEDPEPFYIVSTPKRIVVEFIREECILSDLE